MALGYSLHLSLIKEKHIRMQYLLLTVSKFNAEIIRRITKWEAVRLMIRVLFSKGVSSITRYNHALI